MTIIRNSRADRNTGAANHTASAVTQTNRLGSNCARAILAALLVLCLPGRVFPAGFWTPLANQAPGAVGHLMLLSDGTVMVENNNDGGLYGPAWYRLTPDSSGHYINGTWSAMPSMTYTRLFFASQMLKDGRIFVAGGEYGTGGNTGEVFDPMANAWTSTPLPGHTFSDADSEVLPDGRVLVALVEGTLKNTLIYDPVANTWTNGPACNGIHNESAWVKLPDASILMVDRLSTSAERYIPSLNQWLVDATVPVALYDQFGDEMGPGFLLPNGKVIYFGSTGFSAIYTPSGTTNNGSWAAGPTIPNGLGCPDAPGAMMPNGKILLATAPVPISGTEFRSPTSFYEFDYTANTYTQVTAPAGGTTETGSSFQRNFLLLPDGTVLSSRFGTQLHVYTPDGTPLAAAKPAIQSLTQNPDGSYHLVGTQLNGLSSGAAYGDDDQDATDYPLAGLADGAGNFTFARTHDWSSTGVMTGTNPVSTEVTVLATFPSGTYSLYAIANGIRSDPVPITLVPRLTVRLPASALKGAGTLSNAGTVVISDPSASDLTVSLASSLTNRLLVPASVVIPAGQRSNTFDLTVVFNTIHDGNQVASVTAATPGYAGVTASMLMIDNNTPPAITNQPASVTAAVGANPSFTVGATSPTQLSYYWSRGGIVIPGATSSVYTVTNAQLADSGSQFSCLVSNAFGTVQSLSATLTVMVLPSDYFSELFGASITNLAFNSFTFTPDGSANYYYVCVTPTTAFPTDPTGGTVLAETDDSALGITLTGGNTVAIYHTRTNVLFVGSNGYLTMNSADTSYNPTYASHFSLPRVAALYRDLNPPAGGTVSWKQLSDRAAITYQGVLIYGSTNQANNFQIEMFFDGRIRISYLGLNTPTALVGLSGGGGQAANFAPSDFTTYQLCAPIPPSIVSQTGNQSITAGTSATFSVAATGSPLLTYAWLLNGSPIAGATSSVYVTNNVPVAASGSQYSCLITNQYGSTNTLPATLTVIAVPPNITSEPVDQSIFVAGSATFSVTATGSPPLSYFWLLNGNPIAGATNSSYTTNNVPVTASGSHYLCVVTNLFGSTNSTVANLTVTGIPPSVTVQPTNQSIQVGGTGTFSVAATGSPQLGYSWLLNGSPIAGATNPVYTTNNVPVTASGSLYRCLVTNPFGSTNSVSASLTVIALPPTITTQPVDQNIPVGGTAAFSLAASGSPPLSYYWARNGIPIPGATRNAYFLGNVQQSDGGAIFSCLVSNQFGTLQSSNAMLNVVAGLFVAYYTDQNTTATGPAAPISRVGDIPVQITDISSFNFGSADVLFIDESANTAPTTTLTNQFPAIQAWVMNGGKLVVHDRGVGTVPGSNPFLLGISSATSARTLTADVDVVPPGNTLVTAGPFGAINNANLDGGASSAHGYVLTNNLPAGTVPIICMGGATNELVAFSYPLGYGYVYYATIPLDYYLEGGSAGQFQTNLTNIYAPNVIAYMNVLGTQIQLNNVVTGTNGLVQFNVLGRPGGIYRVLASGDLQTWQTIASVTNLTGTVVFTDPGSTNYPQRYYRCVMP